MEHVGKLETIGKEAESVETERGIFPPLLLTRRFGFGSFLVSHFPPPSKTLWRPQLGMAI